MRRLQQKFKYGGSSGFGVFAGFKVSYGTMRGLEVRRDSLVDVMKQVVSDYEAYFFLATVLQQSIGMPNSMSDKFFS